jgi:hypothetical protein
MDLREIEWDGIDLIDVAEDRNQWGALVNTIMKFWVRLNAGTSSVAA